MEDNTMLNTSPGSRWEAIRSRVSSLMSQSVGGVVVFVLFIDFIDFDDVMTRTEATGDACGDARRANADLTA